MRSLKKINRGVLITLVALICVSGYLLVVGMKQNAEKPAIKSVVESYTNTYVNYNMLPEQYRIATPNMSQSDMDSYVAQMENDIKAYFAPGDNSYVFMTDALKRNLENQNTNSSVIYSYTKTVSKYDSFNFDGNTVTVTFDNNTSYNGPNTDKPFGFFQSAGNSSSSGDSTQMNAVTTDSVVLKKVDGSWKVVYSDINQPSQRESFGGGFHIRRRMGG